MTADVAPILSVLRLAEPWVSLEDGLVYTRMDRPFAYDAFIAGSAAARK